MHPILYKLTRSRAGLLAVLERLNEQLLDVPADDGWTIRQTLTHLVASEDDHRRVIEVFIRGDHHLLPQDFEINAHNAARLNETGHLALDDLRGALVEQRERTIALFTSLSEEQLAITGPHPALGDISAEGIFKVIALHEKMHTRAIAAALTNMQG